MVVNPQEEALREESLVRGADIGGPAAGAPVRQANLWRDAVRRYLRNRAAVVAGSIFVLVVLYSLIVPLVSPYDPNKVDYTIASQEPSLAHPFGTDQFGHDLFTRAAAGGRVSLAVGFGATIAILVIGVLYGAISGFVGGKLDNGMMRVLDALYGLPYLPFAIIVTQMFVTVTLWVMVIALSIASWFTAARIVRGQVMTIKENDYIRAAKAVGARWYRVLGRHILPNTLGVLVIAIFLELPGVILGEAFLSFIGLGINPPDASWGSMAQDGLDAYRTAPWVIAVPSIAIAIAVLSANYIADGMRDALDPRTRES